MDVTRRFLAEAALAVALAVAAVVLGRPLLLAGTAGICGWLLARQVAFVRGAVDVVESATVEQTLDSTVATVDEAVAVTLSVELDEPAPSDVTVAASPPVSTSVADEPAITVAAGERRASTTFVVTPAVAGRQEFGRPTVSVAALRFESTTDVGEPVVLSVEPASQRDVFVGGTGERAAGVFGEHETGATGRGIEPARIRKYVVGDPADRIDWKATARLGEPHVVEFETKIDLRSVLIVDRRASMGQGPAGETKLDYARQVALTYLRAARRNGEPIGLYAVGEEGLTVRESPNATPEHYGRLRRRLQAMEPTDRGGDSGETRRGAYGRTRRSPEGVRAVASRLESDGTAFGSSLRPFFEDAPTYVQRMGTDPLYETVRTELGRLRGPSVVVVLTDDERRAELRDAVRAAGTVDHRVVAFLTPSVVFERGGLADLQEAYDRYADFEQFRRGLPNSDRVSTHEVGPRARIEAVRSARRRGVRS